MKIYYGSHVRNGLGGIKPLIWINNEIQSIIDILQWQNLLNIIQCTLCCNLFYISGNSQRIRCRFRLARHSRDNVNGRWPKAKWFAKQAKNYLNQKLVLQLMNCFGLLLFFLVKAINTALARTHTISTNQALIPSGKVTRVQWKFYIHVLANYRFFFFVLCRVQCNDSTPVSISQRQSWLGCFCRIKVDTMILSPLLSFKVS